MARTKWLKRHSQDEIDRTRDHRIRERVVLNELIMMMDVYDGPVPYKIGAITARIQCADLPRQAVQASINTLIEAGDVNIIDDGKNLVIPWVMDLIRDRSERCAVNKRVAIDREAKRQLEPSYIGPKVEHEATTIVATSETASEINDGARTNVRQTKNHHQIESREKEKHLDPSPDTSRETRASGGSGIFDTGSGSDDDDPSAKPQAAVPEFRPLPKVYVDALAIQAGEEEAARIAHEYVHSKFGRERKTDAAFTFWVKATYRYDIDKRGSRHGPRELAELVGATLNKFGQLDTSLPDSKTLAQRRAAITAPAAH